MAKSNIRKNAEGYGYKYTDLAEVHNYLESIGASYYQVVETIDGADYIVTIPIIDGEEKPTRRGCRIAEGKLSGKSNPAQEQGAAITYARRYSLLMAFGLATTDDDAACMTVTKSAKPQGDPNDLKEIERLAKEKNIPLIDICSMAGVVEIGELEDARRKNCIAWLKEQEVRA